MTQLKKIDATKHTTTADFIAGLDKSKGRTSMREMAAYLGISFGHLSDLISRNKKLTTKTVHKLAIAGLIDPKSSTYLRTLIAFEAEEDPETRILLLRELNQLGKSHACHKHLIDQDDTLSSWYLSTVRKLLLHPALKGETEDLHKHIKHKPSLSELAKNLEAFARTGVITKIGERLWKANSRRLNWGKKNFENLYLQNFHRLMLKRTEAAIADHHKERDFQCMTFLADPHRLEEMKQRIDRFLERFYETYSQEFDGSISEDSIVFQFNTQLFKTSI